ncbi:hypothetical protein PZN02_004224 [Sinorhizobium garamanticum]|uniref:Uncharacterized protein n=1 Tax=Sinorhizobium garamanticum TaxID=680247 RepID=A0ABY8DKG5_9HYPH|nr:hypothetical protein [Sinorhizobium garamanticum]WEX90668.1 hypothetical protein PZN02_004224 [Sinorhizobium garamanticum]
MIDYAKPLVRSVAARSPRSMAANPKAFGSVSRFVGRSYDTPYTLLTVDTSADPAKEQRAWQIFREHGIGGVFYVTMFHRHVPPGTEFPNTPTVLVNCSAPERALPSVVQDDYQGGLDVVRHLVQQASLK